MQMDYTQITSYLLGTAGASGGKLSERSEIPMSCCGNNALGGMERKDGVGILLGCLNSIGSGTERSVSGLLVTVVNSGSSLVVCIPISQTLTRRLCEETSR